MRRSQTFTEKAIKALAPGKELRDQSLIGFGIRTHASGATWFFAYSLPTGQRRRLKLGAFPVVTLSEAKGRALDAKRRLDLGEDPSTVASATRNSRQHSAAPE